MNRVQNKKYIPQDIEHKWQNVWEEKDMHSVTFDSEKKTYYNLVELPYPSGDLHLGHWFSFVTADAHARYQKMKGYNVFFPNGFDAFGLPAENAAIKRGINPKDWTMSNIATMRKQFDLMGTMIDWSHEVITCLPEYYQWNQWIFLQLFQHGLAYRGKALGNWCPVDQTVLANEHVDGGKCWRCGAVVIQKEIEQWFLKITQYADALLWTENSEVDWPKSVREGQNNWIGKKEGMLIKHAVVDLPIEFQTFTAYPAWSWADTFIVIAPEHPLIKELIIGTEHELPVNEFIKEVATLTSEDRIENKFEKKGIFTGRYALDPFGGDPLPIWVANFALMNFGTGIIRCSAHDPRDYEFAQKYTIPLKEVVDRIEDAPINAHTNKGVLLNSGKFTGKDVSSVIKEVMDWIEEKGIGIRHANFHIHDWSISRQRYWGTPIPIIHCDDCGLVPVPQKDLPVVLPEGVDFNPQGEPPLATAKEWLTVACPTCGKDAKRDAETLDTFFDSSWYFYRSISPHDTVAPFDASLAEKILPVDVYFGGAEHTLGHTLYARFFTKFFKSIGLVSFDEFAKRRIQHGVILGPDGNRMSKSKGNVVNPDELVKNYGADTVRTYLCFMMPYESTAPWSPEGIWGSYRFLKRVWDIQYRVGQSTLATSDLFWMHRAIKKVGEDIASMKFNTAVSTLMTWLNYIEAKESIQKEEYANFLLLLAPFAPHMTEEIWQSNYLSDNKKNKEFSSIHQEKFPLYEEKYLVEEVVSIAVAINGKTRETIIVDSIESAMQSLIEEKAMASEKILKYVKGKEIKKIIYVPRKILNFVI